MTARRSAAASSDASETASRADSILNLARTLVQIPSRAGEDPPEPIIAAIGGWLEGHEVPVSVLHSDGAPVAVLATIEGAHTGPTYGLDACLDTAPFGDERAWEYPPTSGHVEDGQLHGRGAADSKMAVAIFAHLAAELATIADTLHGRLVVLFDCDEHTGGFAGAKAFLARYPEVAGVMIGYPGTKQVVVGAPRLLPHDGHPLRPWSALRRKAHDGTQRRREGRPAREHARSRTTTERRHVELPDRPFALRHRNPRRRRLLHDPGQVRRSHRRSTHHDVHRQGSTSTPSRCCLRDRPPLPRTCVGTLR